MWMLCDSTMSRCWEGRGDDVICGGTGSLQRPAPDPCSTPLSPRPDSTRFKGSFGTLEARNRWTVRWNSVDFRPKFNAGSPPIPTSNKTPRMSNVFKPGAHAELLERLRALEPTSERAWGRMSPHQAVCHLSDSFKAILHDRPLETVPMDFKRRVMRFTAFTLPLPWPEGVPTSPQVDAEKGGTPPGDFAGDVQELVELLERFVASDGRSLEPHYVWGDMSRGEWGRCGYRHMDHHLRQFGA